jgi:hypothetical protein
MKIIDVIHLDMHGGGIRVVTSLETSKKKVKRSVNIFIDKEVQYGLDKIDTYLGF